MRFGYQSQWAGEQKAHARPETIAEQLVAGLRAKRQACMDRPLILVTHSFGGIITMQAIIRAEVGQRHVFQALIGIVFFGTPFRGNTPSMRDEVTKLARLKYDKVYGTQLRTSSSDSEFLRTTTGGFNQYLRGLDEGKPRLTFFFETKMTNVNRLFSNDVSITPGLMPIC